MAMDDVNEVFADCEDGFVAETSTDDLCGAVARECMRRWFKDVKCDERCNNFESRFVDFVSELPDNVRIEVMKHFERFQYFSHKRTNALLEKIFLELNNLGCCDYDSTVYSHVPKSDGTANSSIDLLIEFKQANAIPNECVAIDQSTLLDAAMMHAQTIVFVDDFCGTGNSFIKLFRDVNLGGIRNTKIVYAVVCCMEEGEKRVEKWGLDKGLHVEVISPVHLRACYEKGECREKSLLVTWSREIGVKKDFELGYKKTQALVAFHSNTPNNTFGYIWSTSSNYEHSPLFPRKERGRPNWLEMAKKARMRKESCYRSKVNGRSGTE
nr:hypothetical protein [Adlercreutzia muris]